MYLRKCNTMSIHAMRYWLSRLLVQQPNSSELTFCYLHFLEGSFIMSSGSNSVNRWPHPLNHYGPHLGACEKRRSSHRSTWNLTGAPRTIVCQVPCQLVGGYVEGVQLLHIFLHPSRSTVQAVQLELLRAHPFVTRQAKEAAQSAQRATSERLREVV